MQDNAADNANKTYKSAAELLAGIFDKIKSFVSKLLKLSIKKTKDMNMVKGKSLDDYFKIGSIFVSKRFAAALVIFLILLFYFIFFFALPYMLNKFLFHRYYFDSKELEGFSGRAKIMANVSAPGITSNPKSNSSVDSPVVIYDGEMVDGKCSGYGTLYNKDQKLKYSGEFKLNNYDGKGSLYGDNGMLLYQGDFKSGLFDGSGTYYYPYCKEKYVGGFKNGLYDGEGTISYNDILIYSGNFKQGKYNGQGTLYNIFGNKIYSGNFLDGLYEGQGTEYSSDIIRYKGSFQNGKYNGSGKLYDIDTGNVSYEGEFKGNEYDGIGTLYDKKGMKLFHGSFIHGDINYLDVLGMPDSNIKSTFFSNPEIDSDNDYRYLSYNDLGITLVMSSSTPQAIAAAPLSPEIQENVSPSFVDKIILWDKYELSGINNTMSADKVTNILGKPFYGESFTLSSIDNKAISVKEAAGYENNIEFDHLYFESFNLNGYTINIAFESRGGNQIYMILSKGPIIRGLG